MAGIIQEFKEFAMRGNVVDLAVGFIMGGAFNKIVTTLVDKIIMPPLGWAMKGVDFNSLALALPIKGDGDKPVTVGYGAFINDIIHFVIVAFALFMLIKVMNVLKKKQEVAPAVVETPPDVKLLGEIRDLLKQRA